MYHSKLACIFILLMFCISSRAQDKKLISGNFVNYSFSRFVSQVEAASGYHFFYEDKDVDSIVINIEISHASINEVLEKVFENTNLHYAVDSMNRIFINKYFSIKTTLPAGFFDNNYTATDTLENFVINVTDQSKTATLNISPENKLFTIGIKTHDANGKATVAGYIRDSKTGEAIAGATVSADTLGIGVSTDQYGYYSITLPKGYYVFKISSAGKQDTRRQIQLYANGKLNIDMQDYVATLKNVIVSSEKRSNTLSTQMGVSNLSIVAIKQMPAVLGETDIIKAILALPGVASVGEASTGFNVRGGSSDQNLILFGDATIYNPSHLFGFFSAFNPDDVSNVELYKSSIPEQYGGRLSSVLDISLRDGNSNKWVGDAGIGPLTSRLTIEGPIKKNKTSMIASVRTTYSDWLLHALPNNEYNKSNADFYDASIHITHIINDKNTIYLSGYTSDDKFNLNNDTTYEYSNRNANLKWKHIFNNKLHDVVTAAFDQYKYSVSSTQNPVNAFNLGFNIKQSSFKADFNYTPDYKNKIDFGLTSIYYKLDPGSLEPFGERSLVLPNIVPSEQALESALYAGDEYTVNSKLSLNGGIHYSMYDYLGPHSENTYVPGIPRDTTTITGSTYYSVGKVIKTYQKPEVRVSARYLLSKTSSLKLSYNTTAQYIHMLSNTTEISPTDIWKLSDPFIKPQEGTQYSFGYYRDFKKGTIQTSVEVYYKQIDNYLDYKNGAVLLLNSHIETDVINSEGKAYGTEFLIKKTTGKLNGWLSYTYSRTFLRTDDPLAGQPVNDGNYYPADFDKPNNVNLIANYRFSHRYSISGNVVYSTGRPITLPLAVFTADGAAALYYSQRNEYRVPDYFRCDLSVNIDGNHKVKQRLHGSWSFGVYNLTARQNVYSIYFTNVNGKVQGYQLSIFGTAIPFVTFNLKF